MLYIVPSDAPIMIFQVLITILLPISVSVIIVVVVVVFYKPEKYLNKIGICTQNVYFKTFRKVIYCGNLKCCWWPDGRSVSETADPL